MLGSGKASAAIWTAFDTTTTAVYRIIKFMLKIAWTRVVRASTYAVVGTSVVGGYDLVKGEGTSAVTSTDVFDYFDETERLMRLEYDRSLEGATGGISMALMDIVLDNSDQRFTPEKNGTIGTAILPNRPSQAYVGFLVQSQNKTVPVFKGITKMPRESKQDRTVSIQCIDYAKYLNEFALDSEMYVSQRSDQIIQDILTTVGFGSTQYVLDTGLNTINFAWFDKGVTAGERIRKICEAEGGFFYQDEEGTLRFENRNKDDSPPRSIHVWNIDQGDIISWKEDENTQVINKVQVSAKPRVVQALAEIWRDGIEEQINAHASIEVWANLTDPASTVTSPVDTTDFTAFTGTGGTGSNITTDVEFVLETFATAVKMTITNNNASKAYVNYLRLRGTSAIVVGEVTVSEEDATSIAKYNENILMVENDFIDSPSYAETLANDIIADNKDPARRIILTVQGIPQLQLKDRVWVYDNDLADWLHFKVTRIQGTLDAGSFTQILYLTQVGEDIT